MVELVRNVSKGDEAYTLWFFIAQARKAISKARQNELRHFGITVTEAAVLRFIGATKEPVTPSQISRWILQEPHSITGLMKRMEAKKLIARSQNPNRKNQINIKLTEKGETAYYQSLRSESVNRIMSVLSKEVREDLISHLFTIILQALKEASLERKSPYRFY